MLLAKASSIINGAERFAETGLSVLFIYTMNRKYMQKNVCL